MKYFPTSIIPVFCLLSISLRAEKETPLAICSIFRDEEPFLLEWVDYHYNLGCRKFFLFNDCGSVATRSKTAHIILDQYIKSGIVDLKYRDEVYGANENDFLNFKSEHVGFQIHMYNEICRRERGRCKWIACIDLDEYIKPNHYATLPELLDAEYADAGAIFLNWRCFGTGEKSIPLGSSLLSKLTMKALDWDPENKQGKCIVRPSSFSHLAYLHYATLKDGYFYRDGDGRIMQWANSQLQHPDFCTKNAVIHHYVLRDLRHFSAVKYPRLKRRLDDKRIKEWVDRFSTEKDESMISYLKAFHPGLWDKINTDFYQKSFEQAILLSEPNR